METNKFDLLKTKTQEIIDLVAIKDFTSAHFNLVTTSELIDEILDNSENDEDLIELSKFQVLLNQLFLQINSAN